MLITDDNALLDFEWHTTDRPHDGRSVAAGASAEDPSNRGDHLALRTTRFGWSFWLAVGRSTAEPPGEYWS